MCELSYWPGQLGMAAGSGSPVPTPTRTSAMLGKRRTRSGAQSAAEADASWKTFLKIKLDYYMGYDRN